MVVSITIYALRCKTLWLVRPDPGPHLNIDPAKDTAGQADKLAQHNLKKRVYNSRKKHEGGSYCWIESCHPGYV
jgi:hypothetical protein